MSEMEELINQMEQEFADEETTTAEAIKNTPADNVAGDGEGNGIVSIPPKTNNTQINEKTYLKFESETEEKMLVGYFYKDRSTFLKLARYLTTKNWEKNSFFNDNKLQFIMNACYQYSNKYKKMPNENVIFSMIEKGMKDKYLQNQTKKLFTELKDTDYSQYSEDYIKDVAVEFIKRERAIEATYMCSDEIAKGNYDGLSKIMTEAVNVNLDKDLGLSIKNVAETLALIKDVHEDGSGCTWGSATFDQRIGKLQSGEIAVLAGVPGAGKTAWLGHFGVENYKKGKNVALFSFEVNKQRLSTRLYKTIFNIGTKELLNFKEEEAYIGLNNPGAGDIRIFEKPANTCSSNDMAAILNDLRTYENWEPDLILVDYILIASTNDKRRDSSDMYKYYKTVTEELRNLAKEFRCPLITAVQLNREAMGEKGGSKAVVTSKDISESRGVLDTADYVFIIEQTDKEKYLEVDSNGNGVKGLYRLRSDKNRNGDNGFTVPFNINWKTLKITEAAKEVLDKKK